MSWSPIQSPGSDPSEVQEDEVSEDMQRERIIAVQGVCEEGKEEQEEKLEQELGEKGKGAGERTGERVAEGAFV